MKRVTLYNDTRYGPVAEFANVEDAEFNMDSGFIILTTKTGEVWLDRNSYTRVEVKEVRTRKPKEVTS